jgi:hypothetical protein
VTKVNHQRLAKARVFQQTVRSRKALLDRNERKRTFRAKESAFVSATAS